MITLKQLEALTWVVRLGGFAAAAQQLHTTQSAISKRMGELEERLGTQIFDRSYRTARLTEKGRELFILGQELLEHRDRVVEQVSRADVITRDLRLGITELTALTWLPRLVEEIGRAYPRVSITQEIATSARLFDGLADEKYDVVIAADIADRRHLFKRTVVGTLDNAWMCAPQLIRDFEPRTAADLARFSILVQGQQSGTWIQYGNWLRTHQIDSRQIRFSNDLIAQIGFTLSGLGVSYLPSKALGYLVNAGRLSVLNIPPRLSPVPYVAVCRADRDSKLHTDVIRIAARCCDFSKLVLDVSGTA
jgi:DNA-binding transcriptional LysR family regulator